MQVIILLFSTYSTGSYFFPLTALVAAMALQELQELICRICTYHICRCDNRNCSATARSACTCGPCPSQGASGHLCEISLNAAHVFHSAARPFPFARHHSQAQTARSFLQRIEGACSGAKPAIAQLVCRDSQSTECISASFAPAC